MNLIPNAENLNPSGQDRPTRGSDSGNPPPVPPPAPQGKEAEESGSFGGLRVSLMPAGQEEETGSLRRWLIVLMAALLIETVAIGGGYLYMMNLEATTEERRTALEQNINDIASKIDAAEERANETARFSVRAKAAAEILEGHLYWTKLFQHLGSRTKPGVSYLNFSGDVDTHAVAMDALGTNYREVAEQIVALREDEVVESVVTTSASALTDAHGEMAGVSFSLLVTLKPEMWSAQTGTEGENE